MGICNVSNGYVSNGYVSNGYVSNGYVSNVMCLMGICNEVNRRLISCWKTT